MLSFKVTFRRLGLTCLSMMDGELSPGLVGVGVRFDITGK